MEFYHKSTRWHLDFLFVFLTLDILSGVWNICSVPRGLICQGTYALATSALLFFFSVLPESFCILFMKILFKRKLRSLATGKSSFSDPYFSQSSQYSQHQWPTQSNMPQQPSACYNIQQNQTIITITPTHTHTNTDNSFLT